MKKCFLRLLIFCGFSFEMSGHLLDTHRNLTRISVREFFQCVGPDFLAVENRDNFEEFLRKVSDGNIWEDMSHGKLLQYSHFYNPKFYVNAKWLGLVDRCPSNYKIMHIEAVLGEYFSGFPVSRINLEWDSWCRASSVYESLRTNEDPLDILGQAIHHLQDMSSPTHVVPIAHPSYFSWDGFESYKHRNGVMEEIEYLPLNNGRRPCAFLSREAQTLLEVLDRAARGTLSEIDGEVPVEMTSLESGKTWMETVSWRRWYGVDGTPDANGMKKYGIYGNVFGVEEFEFGGIRIRVDERVYRSLVLKLYRRSVEDTKKALYYFWTLAERNMLAFNRKTN